MTWLRVDDKFPRHPKVAALTDREFRVHVRVLCWCSEYDTEGNIPDGAYGDIVGLTRKMGVRFYEVGLWDEVDGMYVVHDFGQYRPKDPSGADRQKAWRDRNAKRNGRRNAPVTENVTETVTDESSRAGSRAGAPVPVPALPSEEVSEAKASSGGETEDDPIDEQAVQRVYASWRVCFKKTRANYRTISPKRRAVIRRRLKKHSPDDLIRAMKACVDYETPRWWLTHNDLDVVLKSEGRVDHFLELADNPPATDELEPRRNGKGLSSADIRALAEKEAS